MKKQADMKKKQTAAKADATAQLSVDDTLREWYAHDGWDVSAERDFIKSLPKTKLKKEFCDGIDRYLSRSVAATMRHYKDHNANPPKLCVSEMCEGAEIVENELLTGEEVFSMETGIRLARNFMCGDFDTESLRAIGVDALYNLMLRFYRLWQSERELNVFYSTQYHPQLLEVLDARKFGGLPVQVCGEGIDIARAIRKLEERQTQTIGDGLLAHYHHNPAKAKAAKEEAEKLAKKIDEYKTRLRELGEEVYETLKRAESRNPQGTNAIKKVVLELGAKDPKEIQREDAAEWIKAEYRNHRRQYTYGEVADYFYTHKPELFTGKDGYDIDNRKKFVVAFGNGLRNHTTELGISDITLRDPKRGRPPKAEK